MPVKDKDLIAEETCMRQLLILQSSQRILYKASENIMQKVSACLKVSQDTSVMAEAMKMLEQIHKKQS